MQAFFEQNEYTISFIAGIIAIAHFAYFKLREPVVDDHTRRLPEKLRQSPWVVASRSLFLEAYFYYTMLLLGSYVVLCFSEPIYKLFIEGVPAGANRESPFDPTSGAWPLAVALLIVRLSPNVPFMRDAEVLFRWFSRQSAGIPRNFLDTLERIRQLRFKASPGEDNYLNDIAIVEECLAAHYAFNRLARPTFDARMRGVRRAFVLFNWTISPDTPVHWSMHAEEKLAFIEETLAGELRDLRDRTLAIASVEPVEDFVKAVRDKLGRPFEYDDRDNEAIAALWGACCEQTQADIQAAATAAEEFVDHAPDLEMIYALLITHDPRMPPSSSPYMRRFWSHLLAFQSKFTRNLVFSGVLYGALLGFLATLCYTVARLYAAPLLEYCDPATGAAFGPTLIDATSLAVSPALGVAVSFMGGAIGSIFYLKIRGVTGRGEEHHFGIVPMAYYIKLLIVAFVFSCIGSALLWVAYNIGYYKSPNFFYRDVVNQFGYVLIDSIPGALFGCFFSIFLNKCDGDSQSKLHKLPVLRLAGEVLLAGAVSGGATVVAQVTTSATVANSQLLWDFCRDHSNWLPIVLATVLPPLALTMLLPQMRRISRLRESPDG